MSKAAKWSIIILVALVIAAGGIIALLLRKHNVEIQSTERIENIQSQVDSIYVVKDSIQERIDTVYVKLENNNKQYEKDVNHILANDANEDRMFFLEYINFNRARLDSISYSH